MDTKKLRQKILDLAIHGKLVPQDPNDEPASVLLERIRAEKERLISEGKIKRSRKSAKTTDTPHYPQDVPFEVPEGWEWCKLDDLAFYKKGPFGSSLTKSMFVPDSPDAYKVYEQKNAISKDATLGHYFIDKDKYEELKGFTVQSEDIIVSCAGTIGETYVLPLNLREGIINQALMLIRLFDKSISDFYLLYFDFMLKSEAAKESKGTAIKNIPPFDILKNFYIPLPPFAEQQRIVAEIERWFTLIDTVEQGKSDLQIAIKQTKSKILDLAIHGKLVPQDTNDEPASELLKRINPKAEITCDNEHSRKLPYNWCLCNLGDVCMLENGFAFSSDQYKAKGIPLIRISNIKDNEISLSSCVFINEGYEEKYIVHSGDLLIAMSGATTGKMGIYNQKYVAYLNQRVGNIKIVDSNLLFDKYRNYFLFSQKNKILELAYGGAQPNISGKVINSLFVPLPPIAEQKRIVQKIEVLFSIIDTVEQALQA
ncbi:restriction endonuclease subunit S [Hallella seregens]|uniref:restriction endonuclease subunit S n=1 Tax=Hallella seregens TaxID=52229 RepID=UPI0004893984|nr:restriction endonuclease subunit S [Hallella seregens]